MDPYLAVLGTLAGVLVGGLVNFLASRTVKQQEWRLALARDDIALRQKLYAEFLAEAQRLTAQAIYRPIQLPDDIQTLDRLIAQMRLVSPDTVTTTATSLRRHLLRPASTPETSTVDGPTYNQLSKEFVEAAKQDLAARGDA
jgi:hypothetical protein